MATLYLNLNNTLQYTVKSVIMQRSTVESLNILVPKYYNSEDMSAYYCYLHYITPTSREHNLVSLTISNANYTGTTIEEDKVLSYTLSLTRAMTQETGKLEVWLAFYKVEPAIDDNDELVLSDMYRCSTNCYIPITKASDYDNVLINTADGAFATQIAALKTAVANLQASEPVDMVLDGTTNNLHMVNNAAEQIGDGVDMTTLSNDVGSSISDTSNDPDLVYDGIINADNVE